MPKHNDTTNLVTLARQRDAAHVAEGEAAALQAEQERIAAASAKAKERKAVAAQASGLDAAFAAQTTASLERQEEHRVRYLDAQARLLDAMRACADAAEEAADCRDAQTGERGHMDRAYDSANYLARQRSEEAYVEAKAEQAAARAQMPALPVPLIRASGREVADLLRRIKALDLQPQRRVPRMQDPAPREGRFTPAPEPDYAARLARLVQGDRSEDIVRRVSGLEDAVADRGDDQPRTDRFPEGVFGPATDPAERAATNRARMAELGVES